MALIARTPTSRASAHTISDVIRGIFVSHFRQL
jgi:hypothetical protein